MKEDYVHIGPNGLTFPPLNCPVRVQSGDGTTTYNGGDITDNLYNHPNEVQRAVSNQFEEKNPNLTWIRK